MKAILEFPYKELTGKTRKGGGLVGMVWRGIQVFRNNVIPRNPSTTDQDNIRNYLTQSAQGFQAVTPVEKAGWRTYAGKKKVTISGAEVTLPEIAVYVKVNTMRLIDAVAISDAAPTDLASFVASGITVLAFVDATKTISFIVAHNLAVVGSNQWKIQITDVLPSGAYSPRKNDYRLIKGVATESIIAVTSSPQTVSIANPRFEAYTDGKYVGVIMTPLSAEYDEGTPYEVVQTIAVT